MASANLELVRSIYATWVRSDYRSAVWADPEIEFVIADGPAPGSWTRRAVMAEGWGGFLSVWEEFHAEAVDEYLLDAERVLVLPAAQAIPAVDPATAAFPPTRNSDRP